MTRYGRLVACFSSTVATALLGAASLVPSSAALAACVGPGAPDNTQTQCVTAIVIPGNPLNSFDISWVNPNRMEYYLGDRSNGGVDIINTQTLTFSRTITGFVGIKLNAAGTAVDNTHSGPNGVVSFRRWLYAGDGDSTLKVIDLNTSPPIKQIIATGGSTRLDEMAITDDGLLLLAANNAEDPPFATLFSANGNAAVSNVFKIAKISVDPTIIPSGFGLSLEQPAWDPATQRFFTSIPTIANNPPGCVLGGTPACSGGVLITDPDNPKSVETSFDPTSGTGVVPLPNCGPNGATYNPSNGNLLLGCTPSNFKPGTTSLVISGRTRNTASVNGITGSDEVFFNGLNTLCVTGACLGDNRYYLAASGAIKPASSTLGTGAVLGVVDSSSVLVETIPQSSGSHSVATDSMHNYIFVPQIWTRPAGSTVPAGDANTVAGGTTTVSELLCGGVNGCVVVYQHNPAADDVP
jgi:hypothetical protein